MRHPKTDERASEQEKAQRQRASHQRRESPCLRSTKRSRRQKDLGGRWQRLGVGDTNPIDKTLSKSMGPIKDITMTDNQHKPNQPVSSQDAPVVTPPIVEVAVYMSGRWHRRDGNRYGKPPYYADYPTGNLRSADQR
jgi:hypothetical protein